MRASPWLLALSLMGCRAHSAAEAPAPLGSTAPSASSIATTTTRREPPEDLLDEGVASRHPLRAWIVRNDPLVFAEGRAPIAKNALPMSHAVQGIVVEQVGDLLRVVLEGPDVRLVVLAPPACTSVVVSRPAWLSPKPGAAPSDDAGIRLAPGVRVEDRETSGTSHLVDGEAEGVKFKGWIDAAALDRAFVTGPFVESNVDGLVREGATVTDASGTVVATLPSPFDPSAKGDLTLPVETRANAKPGFASIVYRNEAVEVRGYVRTDDYRPAPTLDAITTSGTGWGDGGGMSDTEKAKLRHDTRLLDEEGAPIGKVRNESTFYLAETRPRDARPDTRIEGWIHVTGLGFVTVHVRLDDLRPW
ncbi:MAG: hypothetical protein U0414_44130 [Polyangiaceae bacterium]